jgi:predicted amino acid dehydrogenase
MKTAQAPLCPLTMHNACIVSDYVSEFSAKLPVASTRGARLDFWAADNVRSIETDDCGNIRSIHGRKVTKAGLVTHFA